jgi:hypothetical protein
MKTIYFTFLSVLLISLSGISQITITSANLPGAGENFIVSQAVDLQIDYASTGTDHQWDFSNLSYVNQTSRDHNSMSGPPSLPLLVNLAYGSFTTTNYRATYYAPYTDLPIDQLGNILPIQFGDINQYTRKTQQRLTLIGYSASISGQGIPIKSDTIETKYVLPLNYGDNYVSRGYTKLDLSAPPLNTLGIDAKWVQTRKRTTVVDGWGEITTPFGTFDALRVKHKIEETDSVQYDTFSVGIDIPVMYEYEWLSDDEKIPVLKVVTTEVLGAEIVISVEYRDIDHVGLESLEATELMVYPNPVSDELVISWKEGKKSIRIFHIDGTIVKDLSFDGATHKINTSDLSSGMYYIAIDNGGDITTKSFIKK